MKTGEHTGPLVIGSGTCGSCVITEKSTQSSTYFRAAIKHCRLLRKKLEGFESHIFAVRTANPLRVRTARLAVQPRSSCGPDRNAAANLPAVRSVA